MEMLRGGEKVSGDLRTEDRQGVINTGVILISVFVDLQSLF